MKVEVKKTKGFTPIELTITIESQEEFDDLYARVELSAQDVNSSSILSEKATHVGSYALWAKLEKLK